MFDNKNYFALFNLGEEFTIDKNILLNQYLKLQNLYHPDKQANKTNNEKLLALQLSQEINKAYNILNNDKSRAEYLLKLNGIIINQEEGNNVAPDPLMLAEILDISENPRSYDLLALKKQTLENFTASFSNKEFIKAAHEIIKLQYLSKIK